MNAHLWTSHGVPQRARRSRQRLRQPLRPGTEDIDTSVRIDAELRVAVRLVAERHGLAIDWLNDHAVPWHPEMLRLEDCDLFVDHPRLRVLGAPLPAVFLMKLNRSQPQDVADMIMMWGLVASAFPTARAVSAAEVTTRLLRPWRTRRQPPPRRRSLVRWV